MEKDYYSPSKTTNMRNSSPQQVEGSPCGENHEAKARLLPIWNSEKILIISMFLLHISFFFINPFRSIVYIALLNILPGYILLRFFLQIQTDRIRMLLFSAALNIIASPLTILPLGSIFGKLSIWLIVASLDIALGIGLLFSKYVNRTINYAGEPFQTMTLVILAILLLFQFSNNIIYYTMLIRVDQGNTLFYFDPIDHFWYCAIIEECARSIPPQTPEYAGVVLTYPWLHLLHYAAIMKTSGIDVISTMIIQNAVMNTIFIALCFIFVVDTFKSKNAGLMAAYLMTVGIAIYWLIVSIETGTIPFFASYQRTPGPQVLVRALAIESLYSGFIRAPGYIVAVLIVFFLYSYVTQKTNRYFIMAFALLSALPFYHPILHLTIIGTLAVFCLILLSLRQYKESIIFVFSTIVSIIPFGAYTFTFAPYLIDLARGNPGGYFRIRFLVGLFVPLHSIQAILIYFGICSVFSFIGFLTHMRKNRILSLLLGSWLLCTILFIVFTHLYRGGNYTYYYSATIPVIFLGAMGIRKAIHHTNKRIRFSSISPLIIVIIIIIVTFVPFWQRWYTTATLETPYYYITDEEMAAYTWIKANTPSDAVFLVRPSLSVEAPSPLITYGARRVVVGNEIHVESQRLYFDQRYNDTITIYVSKDVSLVSDLLKKYDVDYVLVSPRERHSFTMEELQKFDEYPQLFEIAFKNTDVTIYKVVY